ncbi:MAG: response regulator [Alphaproteobacteria bacterium]|nr:MAG: response regulator [Alphaproteobacteria bacterium]
MNEQKHILVVDDDRRLRDLLKRYLSQNNFLVTTVADAAEAEHVLKSMQFDLIVLDVMMPGITGFELTQKLRAVKNRVPILLLTAKDTAEDRINGFEVGADDYLTKPFEPRELVLRIESILRRAAQNGAPVMPQQKPAAVHFGDFVFDLSRNELKKTDGEMIYLTTAETSLMQVLAENAHLPCSREDLVRRCSIEGGERAIDVQVTRLRRKIEADPGFARYLQTVRGKGYMLKPEKIVT